MTDTSSFDVGAFRTLRAAGAVSLGEPLTSVAQTESTNDLALAAADTGAPHGSLFVAGAQTKGRGRHGHTWTSPPGENLTFSLLLRPTIDVARANGLALVVGLGVRAAAAKWVRGAPVTIKWPNDVVVGVKKLAGILVESRLRGSRLDAIVVGVGLNVNMRSIPEDISRVATSLALLSGSAPSRETILVDVLAELEPRLTTFDRDGLEPLLPELRENDALFGARVSAGGIRGTAEGIDANGALLVRTSLGEVERVSTGSVERESADSAP